MKNVYSLAFILMLFTATEDAWKESENTNAMPTKGLPLYQGRDRKKLPEIVSGNARHALQLHKVLL